MTTTVKHFDRVIWTKEDLALALDDSRLHVQGDSVAINTVETRAERCSAGSLFIPTSDPYFPIDAEPNSVEESRTIGKAFDCGAAFALSSLCPEQVSAVKPVWRVQNTKRALELLAQFARDRFRGVVIAVTGSVGKTTTKDMVHQILESVAPSQATIENAGPADFLSTLASVPPDLSYLTLETSSMAPGRIAYKARVAKPNIAIVTNVGVSHAANYSCPDEIFSEKLSLLDYASDGVAIVHSSIQNMDRARSNLLRAKPVDKLVTVGAGAADDIRLCDAHLLNGVVEGVVSVFGVQHRFTLPLPARHFAENMLFALATAHLVGIPIREALAALEAFSLANSRMTRWRVQTTSGVLELIDDSCNAAPKSVEGLLELLSERRNASRRVLVLGDMLELGPQEERLHELLAPSIERVGVGLLITVGPLASRVCELVTDKVETLALEDSGEAVRRAPPLLQHGDLVAIKGSRAMRLRDLVHAIKAQAIKVSRPNPSWRVESDVGHGLRGWLASGFSGRRRLS